MSVELELSQAIAHGLGLSDPYYVVVVVEDHKQTRTLVQTFKPLCERFATVKWNPVFRTLQVGNTHISFISCCTDHRAVMGRKVHKVIEGFASNTLLIRELRYRESRCGR